MEGAHGTNQDFLRRSYEFELMYTFKNLTGPDSPPAKTDLQGQPFDIADCDGVTLLVLDNTDQVHIDNCKNCRIFIAASSESVFIRDCVNCTVTLACKQVRGQREATSCECGSQTPL